MVNSMKSRKWPVILFAIGALAIGVLLIFDSTPIPPRPPMPSPNGYRDFLTATAMLALNTSRYDELTEDDLRALVTTNKPALNLVRTGLNRECRVPLGNSVNALSLHLPELASIKSLARALRAEARLAESDHRYSEAAQAHLQVMKLGQEAMRGGLLIDGLNGIACKALGSAGLRALIENLDAPTCESIVSQLNRIEERRVSFAEALANEQAWKGRTYTFHRRAVAGVYRLMHRADIRQANATAFRKFQLQLKQDRTLTIELAARAYELEKGQPPTDVKELVPVYLKAVPKDPFSDADMTISP